MTSADSHALLSVLDIVPMVKSTRADLDGIVCNHCILTIMTGSDMLDVVLHELGEICCASTDTRDTRRTAFVGLRTCRDTLLLDPL